MALGDGVRRDIAKVPEEERRLFVAALRRLDDPTSGYAYPNNHGHEGADSNGNIAYWDMQEQIHQDGHVHGIDVHRGPGFIPWHRALINHFEDLLRQADSRLSLHYWDWTTDPRVATDDRAALFTAEFMGSASGNAGPPLQDFESTEITGDPAAGFPPDGVHDHIWRAVGAEQAKPSGAPDIDSDDVILHATNDAGIEDFTAFARKLTTAHNNVAHTYIGGSIKNPHFSFHDPFVYLLHSNLDRLWATWQRAPGHEERLVPAHAYGTILADSHQPVTYYDELVQPWAGVDLDGNVITDLNPWKDDPSARVRVAYNDPEIITPVSYDTAPAPNP